MTFLLLFHVWHFLFLGIFFHFNMLDSSRLPLRHNKTNVKVSSQNPFGHFFTSHSQKNWHCWWRNVCQCMSLIQEGIYVSGQVALLHEEHQRENVCFYESVWLAKKALVSPQVGLVHSGQRSVSWREQGWLDFRWDWTRSARACTGQTTCVFNTLAEMKSLPSSTHWRPDWSVWQMASLVLLTVTHFPKSQNRSMWKAAVKQAFYYDCKMELNKQVETR